MGSLIWMRPRIEAYLESFLLIQKPYSLSQSSIPSNRSSHSRVSVVWMSLLRVCANFMHLYLADLGSGDKDSSGAYVGLQGRWGRCER